MTNFVLMTAMPPTTGHRNLINFASSLQGGATVILCTQPNEPLVEHRIGLVRDLCIVANAKFIHIGHTMPQNETEYIGFWDMWKGILEGYGFRPGDRIVASETYGLKLAEVCHGTFIPFDINRNMDKSRATYVREDLFGNWDSLLPPTKSLLQKRVTIFGAESVGKTTMANGIAFSLGLGYRHEFARPFLEQTGAELSRKKMMTIAEGQTALQRLRSSDPLIIQDTDLFSTLGYFEMGDKRYGAFPRTLHWEANRLKSDLYIIPASNIPFEADPLRYGGHEREASDEYWIRICEENNLKYEVVTETDHYKRRTAGIDLVLSEFYNDPNATALRNYIRT